MEKNKRIMCICGIQIAFYLLILIGLIVQFGICIKNGTVFSKYLTFGVMVVALVGCSFMFVLWDYIRNVIRSSNVDVVGVHNKKSLEKKLQEIQDGDDTLNIGIMMFDLNNLKKINDTYGHEQGDIFIKTFASFLTRILTEDSFLARFGGDEFVIVQENAVISQLEQMNLKLQSFVDEYNRTAEHFISYAVGYEVSCKNHYYLIMDLVKIADEKMYQDKKYKKQKQYMNITKREEKSIGDEQGLLTSRLRQKIFTILTNCSKKRRYAFVMTDVNKFHLINDYWGYEVGTEMLNFVLQKMKMFPEGIFIERYHSDIFVGIIDVTGLSYKRTKEKISSYNMVIRKEVLEEYPINYFMLNTGVYYIDMEDIDPNQIISCTNLVRRKAKENNDAVCIYTPKIDEEELRKAETIHSFKNALEKEEFKIYFQPKIGSKEQKIVSAEVLVRWQKDENTIWVPYMFLPILEETGEIEKLDYYIYEKAFQWISRRKQENKSILPLSLNVSPVHFKEIDKFIAKAMGLIDMYHIDSKYIVFEITENTYIHNIEAVNLMIQTFHQRGIRISMDDFGSGYSSLNTLKDIIFDEVKIDKKFLDNEPSEKGKIVLEEIFHLLKRTKKFIVCEGVETKEMVDFLVKEGCDELQGYYYYKPLTEQEFEKSVEENGSNKILLQTKEK
ncbi:MAG: EAL domain-containing protein [Eubacterium sp.]|nr:EAL domain-containing protein [Eubacterium sp.]